MKTLDMPYMWKPKKQEFKTDHPKANIVIKKKNENQKINSRLYQIYYDLANVCFRNEQYSSRIEQHPKEIDGYFSIMQQNVMDYYYGKFMATK